MYTKSPGLNNATNNYSIIAFCNKRKETCRARILVIAQMNVNAKLSLIVHDYFNNNNKSCTTTNPIGNCRDKHKSMQFIYC